jgi:DNA-binding NarL/FixJ family response regulator
MAQQLRSGSDTPALTASDTALLRMLGDGLSNKEMAAELGIAEITAKTRLARLYRRFGVHTRVQRFSSSRSSTTPTTPARSRRNG